MGGSQSKVFDPSAFAVEKRDPPTPVHVEIVGMPLSGRRTLARAIQYIEGFSFEELPSDVQTQLRRLVQHTAAQAALLATAEVLEKPPVYKKLKHLVAKGPAALLRDDKLCSRLLACALEFGRDETLAPELKSAVNPICGTSYAGFSDIPAIFVPDFVPSRKQLMSIHAPDSDLQEVQHISARYRYYPVEFAEPFSLLHHLAFDISFFTTASRLRFTHRLALHPTKDLASPIPVPDYPYYVIFTVSLEQFVNSELSLFFSIARHHIRKYTTDSLSTDAMRL